MNRGARTFLLSALSAVPVLSGPFGPRPRGSRSPEPGQEPVQTVLPEHLSMPREKGEVGNLPPQPRSVLVEDTLVHEEVRGRGSHWLLELAGSSGGFGAAWHDTRTGHFSLYFALFDSRGGRSGPEELVYTRGASARRFEPAIGLAPDLSGAIVWYPSERTPGPLLWRPFVGSGRFSGPAAAIGEAIPGVEPDRLPAYALRPEGGAWLASQQGRLINLWDLDSRGEVRGVLPVNPSGPWASEGLLLAAGETDDLLVAWNSDDGAVFRARGGDGQRGGSTAERTRVIRVFDDPDSTGWWGLVQAPEGLLLRHLDRMGGVDRTDTWLEGTSVQHADLAIWPRGFGLLTVRAPESRGSTRPLLRLRLLRSDGRPVGKSAHHEWTPRGALLTQPRVAASGHRILTAWTERRGANVDIYYRTVRGARGISKTNRLNTDVRSANQRQGDVDARSGDRAVIVWTDDRVGVSRPFARVVRADGTFHTREIPIPAIYPPPETGEAGPPRKISVRGSSPSVALSEDGRFLVCWTNLGRDGWTLRGQPFLPDGRPAGAAFEIDTGHTVSAQQRAALVALRGGRGFVVVWLRGGEEVVSRRITMKGEMVGPPLRISREKAASHPDVALLDDNRMIVAWDVPAEDRNRGLGARFLREDGRPDGDVLRFTPLFQGYDWNPTVAAGPDFGFAMAAVSGRGPTRDVVVRFFDRDGDSLGRPIGATTELGGQDLPSLVRDTQKGGWILAWKDDLYGMRRVFLRRIAENRRELGPVVQLSSMEASSIEAFSQPNVALLSSGVIGVWTDSRRAKGFDLFMRILGPDFDRFDGTLNR